MIYLKQEEEIQNLQKQISLMEAELDQAQNQLAEATTKLETTEKQLGTVSMEVTGIEWLGSGNIPDIGLAVLMKSSGTWAMECWPDFRDGLHAL